MSFKKLVQKDTDDVLYKIALPVEQAEIASDQIKKLIKDMFDTLSTQKSGVALAAPQIGVSKRIFVVSPLVSESIGKEVKNLVYINPKITKKSKETVILDEGCLSVAGWFGKIKRHEKVTVEALDENGKKFTRGASDLLAEIFQHEIDHLDGTLFTKTAKNLRFVEETDDKS